MAVVVVVEYGSEAELVRLTFPNILFSVFEPGADRQAGLVELLLALMWNCLWRECDVFQGRLQLTREHRDRGETVNWPITSPA